MEKVVSVELLHIKGVLHSFALIKLSTGQRLRLEYETEITGAKRPSGVYATTPKSWFIIRVGKIPSGKPYSHYVIEKTFRTNIHTSERAIKNMKSYLKKVYKIDVNFDSDGRVLVVDGKEPGKVKRV